MCSLPKCPNILVKCFLAKYCRKYVINRTAQVLKQMYFILWYSHDTDLEE